MITIRYNNDTGPDDDGFWEWWDVFLDTKHIAKCETEDAAKQIKLWFEAWVRQAIEKPQP